MRLEVRILQDAAHRAVANLDPFAANVLAKQRSRPVGDWQSYVARHRQASASILAASLSEREKAAGPISGRPQACRPVLRNRSASASPGPCAHAHPTRARCPCPARRRPSSAALAPFERRATPPLRAASQQRSPSDPPPTTGWAPSDDRRAGVPPARRIRSCPVIRIAPNGKKNPVQLLPGGTSC